MAFQGNSVQTNAFQLGPALAQTANSPLGWEIPPFQPPSRPSATQRFHGVKGRSGFAFFPPWQNTGWEIAPFQPRHPRSERAGAIMAGHQGIDAPYVFVPAATVIWGWDTQALLRPKRPIFSLSSPPIEQTGAEFNFVQWINAGWEIAPPQPRHPRPEASAALIPSDAGVEAQFIRFVPYGWEVPPIQPRHPRPEAAGAIMPSEAGIEAQYVFTPSTTVLWGWEGYIQPSLRWQFPNPKVALDFGDQGTQAQFVRWINAGWEIPSFQPPVYPTTKQRYAGIKGRSQFPIWSTWVNYGWDIPSFQPPHPRPERAGAIATSEPGIEAQYVFVSATPAIWGWDIAAPHVRYRRLNDPDIGDQGTEQPLIRWINSGWEIPPPLTRHNVLKSPETGDQGTQSPFINWVNYNWHIPPFQPSHPRPERAGAIMPWEQGIEAAYVFVPATPVIWAWDIAAPFVRYRRFVDPEIGDQGTQASFIRFFPSGWEIAPVQPPHPRPERAGAIMPWEAGIEAQYVFVAPTPVLWGWEQPSSQLRRSTTTRYFGIEGTSDFAFFDFLPYGWELPPFQPPHPRPEKTGAWMLGDTGMEAPYVFVAPPAQPLHGWAIQPFQPPAPSGRLDRFAGIVRGQDGIEFPFIRWFNAGWEIPPWQPPHPRPERAAAIMPWEAGIEAQYVFVAPPFVTDAWEVQSWQPPHPRPERWGAIARGDDGIQYPFVRWFNSGWEIAPHQPQHPRPERSGSLARGDDGIEARFIQWLNAGWEIPSFQPPHRAPEWKAAALFKGDDGIEAQFIRWFNMGWEIPPYQPQHPRPERAGSIMVGHQGTDAVYVFVPLPILARFDPNYLTYGQRRIQVTSPSRRDFDSWPPPRKTVTKPTD